MKQHLVAYAVRETSDQSYWSRIGRAFPFQSGGFTVLLDAMPAPTKGQFKIVVRPPKEKEDAAESGKA